MPVGRAQRRLAELADQPEQLREAVGREVLVHERHVGREAGQVAAAGEHLLVRGGEHDAADALVVARQLERLDQVVEQLVREGVARLRLVERDRGDRGGDVVANGAEAIGPGPTATSPVRCVADGARANARRRGSVGSTSHRGEGNEQTLSGRRFAALASLAWQRRRLRTPRSDQRLHGQGDAAEPREARPGGLRRDRGPPGPADRDLRHRRGRSPSCAPTASGEGSCATARAARPPSASAPGARPQAAGGRRLGVPVWTRFDRVRNDGKEQYLEQYDRLCGQVPEDHQGGRRSAARTRAARSSRSRSRATPTTRRTASAPPCSTTPTQHAREWLAGETCRRTLDYFVDSYGDNARGQPGWSRAVTPRAVVRVRREPGRLRVHVHARQPPVAQEHGRQRRRRRARRAGDGVDVNRNLVDPLGPRRRGLVGIARRPRPTAARPALRARDPRDEEGCDRVDSSFQKNDHTAAELLRGRSGWRRFTPIADNADLRTLAGTDHASAIQDDEELVRPGPLVRALHHQRRRARRRVHVEGHPRLHARGHRRPHAGCEPVRVRGRRGRGARGVPAPPAVRARPRRVGRRPGEPGRAPRPRGRGLLRRRVRQVLRRPADRSR